MATTIEFLEPADEPVAAPAPAPPPAPPPAVARPGPPPPPPPPPPRERVAFGAVVGLALVMNLWGLSHNGLGNMYYAAAVKSMAKSWRNFFFVAFDPGGFISVDKPPVALWAQALSARAFGYSSLTLLLPSALAGAGSVAVLWAIVRRWFGVAAATIAAAVLALSPINVAVDRLNLPDPFMILFLLLAAWAVLRSLDARRWLWWLVAAGAFVGLAFNAKMLAAAIPVPALAAAVAVGSRAAWRQRVARLAVFGAACLAFSLPWILAVDFTPASARPYVGGSTNNSEWNLVFGYNGLGRVDGQGQGFGGGGGGRPAGPFRFGSGGRVSAGGTAAAGGVFGGAPGTWRLFSDAVGGQIAWLLPVAALGAAAALWQHRRSPLLLGATVLFAGWLVLHALVFSYSKGIFHSYYTSALAPGLAALVGIGGVALAGLARRYSGWLIAAAGCILVTLLVQLTLSGRAPGFYSWLRPALVLAALAAAGGLVFAASGTARTPARVVATSLAVALAGLTVMPAAWALSETTSPSLNATLPQAGPRGGAAGGTFGSEAAQFAGSADLATFLRSQRTSTTTWDLAETSAQNAAALIAQDDLSVMALGGFLGTDPAATVGSVAKLVEAGKIRFFLAGSGVGPGTGGGFGGGGFGSRFGGQFGRFGGFGGFGPSPNAPSVGARSGGLGAGRGTAGQIMSVVSQVCSPVTSAGTNGALPSRYDGQIYDCAGKGAALAAAG